VRPAPVPSDFHKNALVETNEQLCARYNRGDNLIRRWRQESGARYRQHNHWTPERMDEVRGLIAKGMTAREVSEATGLTRKAVIEAAKRYGLGPWLVKPGSKPGDTRHIPDDYAERWAVLSNKQLAAHYRKSGATVGVWNKLLGLVRPTGKHVNPKPAKTAPPKTITSATVKRWPAHHKPAPMVSNRDVTQAGLAADFLRRFGPVVRCRADGRYDERGTHWRRGSTVLTADEVIERAQRNGWRPWGIAA